VAGQQAQRLTILADLADQLLKTAPEHTKRTFRYFTTVLPGCGFDPSSEDGEANSPDLRVARMSGTIKMQALRDLAVEIESANGATPLPISVRNELMKVL